MARDIDIGEVTPMAAFPMVETFADLPDLTKHVNQVYIVRKATGIFGINRKRAGLYISDGVIWEKISKVDVAGQYSPSPGLIPSNPPSGKNIISNIFVDTGTQEQVSTYVEEPVP